MFIHVSKYKNFTNIYQPSLNKVFVMQLYFIFHFWSKIKNKLNIHENKESRSQIKTKMKIGNELVSIRV